MDLIIIKYTIFKILAKDILQAQIQLQLLLQKRKTLPVVGRM
jgi:hypothetical protein